MVVRPWCDPLRMPCELRGEDVRTDDDAALGNGLFHESGNLPLLGGADLKDRERGRPHVAVVQVRDRIEAYRAVAHLELARRLHEDADLAVARPARHAVVRLRGEHRRVLAHDRVDLLRHLPLVVGEHGDRLREGLVEVMLFLRRLPFRGGRLHRGALLGAEPALRALLRLSHASTLARLQRDPAPGVGVVANGDQRRTTVWPYLQRRLSPAPAITWSR